MPYTLQPTRPITKSLIDNIFLNTIDYVSFSGNLTIQLSDHLFQFILLEGFFKDISPRKINIYERNFQHFNEREFYEELIGMNWDNILNIEDNDPNKSIKNLYNVFVYMLDEYAPLRKLSKKQAKLKAKPWINIEIVKLMNRRDKLLYKYHKSKDLNTKNSLYIDYKLLRNLVTKMKRDAKTVYYKKFFEKNKSNLSLIWKGIKSIVKINLSSLKKDITIIDDKGKNITDPIKTSNLFNIFFVNIGVNIDKKIPNTNKNYRDYLENIKVENSFFLLPTTPKEISEIINFLDLNKAAGPNSLPVFILKVFNNFFSDKLSKIINLIFTTGIFPDLCKIAKVIPIFKKEN